MKVVYVGGGNMAAAMIGGGVRAGAASGDIAVVEPSAERRALLTRDFGVVTHAAPGPFAAAADLIVLAVKPQQMRAACTALRPHVGAATVVSVAAGIRVAHLTRWLATDQVVRAMPNTPALIGAGVSGLVAHAAVAPARRALAEQLLSATGTVVWFAQDAELDAVTAISGSGPAYVFAFIEALMRAAAELGLPDAAARTLAVHTVLGAGKLAAQSAEPIAVLRERVTSKGGTTAAGLASLAQDGFSDAVVRAARAACARAQQMADEFGAEPPA